MFLSFVIFLFGLILGSFFNVCIYRIPRHYSLIPDSKCPVCQHKIRWFHNIPVFSYLFLGGKCFFCKQKISLRYPLVEMSTALLFILIFRNAGFQFSIPFFSNIILFSFGIILFFIDLEHGIIPDSLSLPLILTGVMFSFFPASILSWKQALLGATIGFVTCISIALLCQFFLKKECLGGGDIKLITGLGAFLGITGIFITLFAASVIAIVTLIIIRYDLKKEFPFGPFLILGAILYQFLGNAIINYYLSLWKF